MHRPHRSDVLLDPVWVRFRSFRQSAPGGSPPTPAADLRPIEAPNYWTASAKLASHPRSLSSPARPSLSVFQNHPGLEQFAADPVGLGEVAVAAGGLAVGDAAFDTFVIE